MSKPKANFEKKIEDLEEIAEKLSEGDIALDDAIAQYEKGMELLKECYLILEEAEQKIKILTKKADGDVEEEDFDKEA